MGEATAVTWTVAPVDAAVTVASATPSEAVSWSVPVSSQLTKVTPSTVILTILYAIKDFGLFSSRVPLANLRTEVITSTLVVDWRSTSVAVCPVG